MTELEEIQVLLEDAMEMLEDPELLPPAVSIAMKDAVQAILAGWINEQLNAESEDQLAPESLQLIAQLSEMATGCAYLVGRLEGMKDVVEEAGETVTYNIEPTHPEGQHVTINFNFS
jgi:hypothetical protein